MLYVPRRFVFIHIPRTAGTSITTGLVNALMRDGVDFLCSTTRRTDGFDKHATARQIASAIPDYKTIAKFAVVRPDEDIIKSDYQLHRSELPFLGKRFFPFDWEESVKLSATETLEDFTKRRWVPWLGGKTVREIWLDETVTIFEFKDLANAWRELTTLAGISEATLDRINRGNRTFTGDRSV